ncbi:MAG: hypothetical protein ACLPKW_32165 [Acetobacteraceae bacterium]
MPVDFDPEHAFPLEADQFVGTLAELCAGKGLTRELAVLAVATASLTLWDSDRWDGGTWGYRLLLSVTPAVYGQISNHREDLENSLLATATDVTRQFLGEYIAHVLIAPSPIAIDNWRAHSLAWLTGQGITNQGRVRSDNIATRQCDGLLFRSEPEIHLYRALKAAGITFAPLPVFVRGGRNYRRIEPDFVVVHEGVVMVVEVDGDTVHHETPAEAHDRTAMLMHEGVHVERVRVADCETPTAASACARHIVSLLGKVKASRT